MKTLALTSSVAALLACASLALAQAPADSPAAQPPAKGMGSMAMPQMQENMKKMQDLMAKIHATKDGAERQKLMQQHSQAMQEQMQMMRGMGHPGPRAQGGPPMGDGAMNQMNRQAMQGRMDMMEMMMGQMLQHQEAQQDAKPAK